MWKVQWLKDFLEVILSGLGPSAETSMLKWSKQECQNLMAKYSLLYISTSVWVPRTPNDGQNISFFRDFSRFWCKDEEKLGKQGQKQGLFSNADWHKSALQM